MWVAQQHIMVARVLVMVTLATSCTGLTTINIPPHLTTPPDHFLLNFTVIGDAYGVDRCVGPSVPCTSVWARDKNPWTNVWGNADEGRGVQFAVFVAPVLHRGIWDGPCPQDSEVRTRVSLGRDVAYPGVDLVLERHQVLQGVTFTSVHLMKDNRIIAQSPLRQFDNSTITRVWVHDALGSVHSRRGVHPLDAVCFMFVVVCLLLFLITAVEEPTWEQRAPWLVFATCALASMCLLADSDPLAVVRSLLRLCGLNK